MTSAINYTNIDETYPIAGKDNNSQGFRDNFSYIKLGLTTAASEISNLQTNTAKLNDDNNFNGKMIENAEFTNVYNSFYGIGTVNGATFIDIRNGHYQTVTAGGVGPYTLTFSNWPASGVESRIRVDIVNNGTPKTITLATTSGVVIVDSTFTGFLSLDSATDKRYVIEAWTINGGNTVYVRKVGAFQPGISQ